MNSLQRKRSAPARRNQILHRRAAVEPLERRRLLAAFLTGGAAPLDLRAAYNLTREGIFDWAHWNAINADGSNSVKIRKSTGGNQISNLSLVGTGGTRYGASGSANDVALTWSDGTPMASPSPDPERIKIFMDRSVTDPGYVPAGWSFTVPADTTPRTLYVLAGQKRAGTRFTAHLSDGPAADFIVNDDPYYDQREGHTNDPRRLLYTIDYEAASAGQSVTITLVKTANLTTPISDPNGSVDLFAAWMRPDVHAQTISPSQINVTWKDSVENELGFEIDYSPISDFSSQVLTVVAAKDTSSKWITGLSPSTTYYIRVRSVNAQGQESANIGTVSAKTPSANPTVRNSRHTVRFRMMGTMTAPESTPRSTRHCPETSSTSPWAHLR